MSVKKQILYWSVEPLSCIDANLDYLVGAEAITPGEAGIIRNAILPEMYHIEPSLNNSDNPTLIAEADGKEFLFHDRNDPVAEAERKASTVRHAGVLMMGLGLGYEFEAVVRSCPQLRNAAVIEYEPALLKAALERIDLSAYPHIKWSFWIGDLSKINILRFIEFEKETRDQLVTISNPAAVKLHSSFMERLRHTYRMIDNIDTIGRLLKKSLEDKCYDVSYDYLMQTLYEVPFPRILRIEPTNFCNLKCTICPAPGYPMERKGFMDMALYGRILDELGKIAPDRKFYLFLYFGGESLLHKNICEMIRMASKLGHFTHLNTNATLLTEEMSENLIRAGLSRIQFSFDDFTPEQHEKIRVGSDRGEVYGKIIKFIEIQRRLGSETPQRALTALKIPTAHNSTRPLPSREYVQLFKDIPMTFVVNWAHHWASDFTAVADGMAPREPIRDYYPCQMLWKEMTIRWDGTIVPCCYDLCSDNPLGRFADQSLLEIWNNDAYTALRQLHIAGRVKQAPLCRGCSVLPSTREKDEFFGDAVQLYKKHAH
jgi:radical SAM protein with 4Fe4S-binding SPASM domain